MPTSDVRNLKTRAFPFAAAAALAASLFIFFSTAYAQQAAPDGLPVLGKEKSSLEIYKKNPASVDVSMIGPKLGNAASDIRLNSSLQVDMQRVSVGDAGATSSGFFPQRARPAVDLRFGNIYRLNVMPVLGDVPGILDAHLDARFADSLKVRFGRVRGSLGRENMLAAIPIFNERAFPINLVPNREIGGQIYGELLGRAAEYQIGLASGTAINDSGTVADENGLDNSGIDLTGRLSARPFRDSGLNLTKGLGLGVTFDYRAQHSNTIPGGWGTPSFRSPGQRTFISNSYDVYTGGGERVFPQLYYHNGPFGMLGEYIFSQQATRRGSPNPSIGGDAFQVQFAWALSTRGTKGNSSLPGPESKNPLDWRAGGAPGTLQLLTRYSELSINRDILTNELPGNNSSVRNARDVGIGLNWFPDRNIKVQLNYDQTSFEGGAPVGTDKPDEKILFSKMYLSF